MLVCTCQLYVMIATFLPTMKTKEFLNSVHFQSNFSTLVLIEQCSPQAKLQHMMEGFGLGGACGRIKAFG